MGGCVSLYCGVADYSASPTATVISITGELCRYGLPTTVHQVLSSELTPCFICISDSLLYDQFIPALNSDDDLLPDQIYFILPKSKLQYRLSASDMAAMAVRASRALQKDEYNKKERRSRLQLRQPRRRNNKSSKISPALVDKQEKSFENNTTAARAAAVMYSRSRSVRKLPRTSSKRVKMAVRSFRMKLSTIYEGSVL